MPEHVQVLIGEPRKGDPSGVLQVPKQKTSRALRGRRRRSPTAQLSLRFTNTPDDAVYFWQRRFYDFNAWSAKKAREKLDDMHLNPVKRTLVAHPKDRSWSSWLYYERGESGFITIDSPDQGKEVASRRKRQPLHPWKAQGCGTHFVLALCSCATRPAMNVGDEWKNVLSRYLGKAA